MAGKSVEAKRLAILGYLLLALHVLFGITAIMGMLINHMLVNKAQSTVYASHLRWQLITFWICAALYLAAFYLWFQNGLFWPVVLVLCFCLYRVCTGVYYLAKERAIPIFF